MRKLVTLFFAWLTLITHVAWAPTALAADVGLFIRNGFSTITSPVAGKTWVLNQADNTLYKWSGSAWQAMTPPHFKLDATTNPGVGNDSSQGYLAGSIWFNTTAKKLWVCKDNSVGAAVWDEYTNALHAVDVVGKLTLADCGNDFVASGLLGSDPGASLAMTTPSGVAYVSGARVVSAGGAFTYTASKDTYDYLQADGTISHIAVPNNDPAPTGQTGLAIQKVITNGSEITSVSQLARPGPQLTVADASAALHAVNRQTGDARYAGIAITTSGVGNQAYMSPDGSGGTLTARSILNSDLPIISIAKGGLGQATSATANGLVVGNGSVYAQVVAPSTPSTYLRWNAAGNAFEYGDAVRSAALSLTNLPFLAISGSPITTTGTFALSPNCAAGDLFYGSATNVISKRTIGATNDVLTVIGGMPTWQAPAATTSGIWSSGRLTVESNVAVSSADQLAKTTLYFTPYNGNAISIWTGSAWTTCTFSQVSVAVPATTNTMYSVWATQSGGTVSISLNAWTNDTTPGTNAVTTTLNGVLVGNADNTKRFLGVMRTTGSSGQTEDSKKRRFVACAFNRVPRDLYAEDRTDTWSYASATWHEANGVTTVGTSRTEAIFPVADTTVDLSYQSVQSYTPTAVGAIGVAMDSVTVPAMATYSGGYVSTGTHGNTVIVRHTFKPAIGYHYFQNLEAAPSAASQTWLGDNGESFPITHQTGVLLNHAFRLPDSETRRKLRVIQGGARSEDYRQEAA